MTSGLRFVALTIFLIGLFVTGLVGTSTSMTFIWPVYFLLGVAATLIIATIFSPVGFSLPKMATLCLVVFSVYLLIRAADSPVGYFAREDVGLIVACLIGYIGFLSLCPTGNARRSIRLVLAALVGVNLLMALLQHLIDPGLWLLPGYERTHTAGVGGLFNQPDHFATFLAALLPLWLSQIIFSRDHGFLKILWSSLAILSVGALLLTGSTAGMLVASAGLGAFFFILVFVVWKRLKPSVRRVGGVLLGTVSLLVISVLFFSAHSIGTRLGNGTLAGDGRANLPEVWEAGLKQFGESPLLGTGSRSSYIYSRTFRSPELGPHVGEPEFVHNEFLQMLADYGIVGLALLLLVLFFHFRLGVRFLSAFQSVKGAPGRLLPRSQHLASVAGNLSFLFAVGTSALFDFSLHLPIFAMMAAISLASLAVPDPMAKVLSREEETSFLPGGNLLFSLRGIGFGCGLAMMLFGFLFSRSEFHYEMARLAFEGDRQNFQQFRHLQEARSLDPQNPYLFTLSAHAQVAGITPEMALPARMQALEKADEYFSIAQYLYPQDVFAAIGHAAVLDELGQIEKARDRIAEARLWAPLYGNLMLAEAEHHLRRGDVSRAEASYQKSLASKAFRDAEAAEEGLRTISEWKLIAQQEGIRWEQPDSGYPHPEKLDDEGSDPDRPNSGIRSPEEARIIERDLAGEVERLLEETAEPETRRDIPSLEELPDPADWSKKVEFTRPDLSIPDPE